MEDFLPNSKKWLTKLEANNISPLSLAFVGDAVQSLYVRTKLVNTTDFKAHTLHQLTVKEVKAESQAIIVKKLMPLFDDEEMTVFKRARNSKVYTPAKNAKLADYKLASGFEAVVGYLYLIGNHDRLRFLLESKNKENE